MMHWRIQYSTKQWFHAYASSDNTVVSAPPNGSATVFSRSDDSLGPRGPVTVLAGDPRYSPDEQGAMKKLVDMLDDELGYPMHSRIITKY